MLIFCKSRNIFLFSVEKIAILAGNITNSKYIREYETAGKGDRTGDKRVHRSGEKGVSP